MPDIGRRLSSHAVGFEFGLGNDAGLDQRCVKCDGIVTVREQKAIATFPRRIIGPELHRVEIGNSKHIGDVERLRDVALALHLAHAHGVAADVIGAISECLVRKCWIRVNHGSASPR